MSPRHAFGLVLLGLVVAAGSVAAQSSAPARPGYDLEFIGPPLADPIMQHAKEQYVLFGCAYCHGVTLTPRGEAADLMHSALVGGDTDGTTIAALLRAGIPQTAKLSPMPQFSDLSDQQLHEIARYIHYARQQGRYKEVVDAGTLPGDAAAGRATFDRNCAGCHATDLAGIGRKYDGATLRDRVLRPPSLQAPASFALDRRRDTKTAAGRERHNVFLENCTSSDVANLMTFLQTK